MSDEIRRKGLQFANFDEVIRDVEQLHQQGYEKAGKWNLGQVLWHCTEWLRFPLDGFPRAGFPVNLILWLLRTFSARSMLKKLFDSGQMPDGSATAPQTVPTHEPDQATALQKLRETIARFQAHKGPFHASPLFGSLDREQLTKLHLLHLAHHLSFLRAKAR